MKINLKDKRVKKIIIISFLLIIFFLYLFSRWFIPYLYPDVTYARLKCAVCRKVIDKNDYLRLRVILFFRPYLVKEATDLGYTLLHESSNSGNYGACKILIENGADVNSIAFWAAKPDGAYTYTRPLHLAASYEIAELLISKDAKVNVYDWKHQTPLHYAARNGRTDIVKLLIKNHADINVKDIDGNTALDLATEANHEEIIKLLKK